ncbi:MAG: alpha-2-macroglobulin, partial [Pirellulales bacterium]
MRSIVKCGAAVAVVLCLGIVASMSAEPAGPAERRAAAEAAYKKGNFRDALHVYRELAVDAKNDPLAVGGDLRRAVECLQRLGRTPEIDALREQAVTAQPKNFRLLRAAADTLFQGPQYGYMVAGKFERGSHRGGGEMVNSAERDRVRALQLMVQGFSSAQADANKADVADHYFAFAGMLLANRGYYDAWRLQYLSDLSQLPDYEQGWNTYREYNGAPVDAEGKPVYHHTVKTFDAAKTDGERWRWALDQVVENHPARRQEVRLHFANFHRDQFDVQTIGWYARYFGSLDEDGGGEKKDGEKKDESGTYALHTLGEDETIARLATGVKRFKLPDEFNFIKIYREIAGAGKSDHAKAALQELAASFENRRQYPTAADVWRRAIAEYGPGQENHRQHRLDQIVKNWGRLEGSPTQPAGKGATIEFRYRNAKKVSFEAHEIKIDQLLADAKAYISARPARLDWYQMDLQNVGYRLVHQNQQKYLGKSVAKWDLDLTTRPPHWPVF